MERVHRQCELTQTFTFLSTAPDHIDEAATHTIDRFIILPYDRTNTATDIVNARRNDANCKEKKCPADTTDKCSPGAARSMSSIPGRTCLGSGMVPAPTLPSLTDWGWIKTSGV